MTREKIHNRSKNKLFDDIKPIDQSLGFPKSKSLILNVV